MKKMTKGAVVTGLGVALLLGGGGTLAVWNADDTADIGIVTAGDLNLDAKAGVWTSNLASQPITNIASYRIIPGEKLTYTQEIDVTLKGNDGLKAQLTVGGIDSVTNSFGGHLQDISYSITDQQGKTVFSQNNMGGQVVRHGKYTAAASFTFNAEQRQAANATLDLRKISYRLTQLTPAQAAGTTGR